MPKLRHLLPLLCAGAARRPRPPWRRKPLIRKNLAERLPNLPKIDEISKTPMPGLYEVRIGTEILYTDEQGNYLIQGELIDTKTRSQPDRGAHRQAHRDRLRQPAAEGRDRHQAGQRRAQDGGVRRPQLRLLQALRARPGRGQGRDHLHLPVPDPRARLDREVARTSGAPRTAPRPGATGWSTAWRRPRRMGKCDTAALERNVELGRKYRVNGTPAMVFEDGTRVPGAIPRRRSENAWPRQPRSG